jgi:uncharacterized protein
MNNLQHWLFRLGLLSELVGQAPCKLGRTGVMKLAFLLQTVKGLPLGYDFRLYTYGPFDSDVLNDLGLAESFGAVKSQLITFPTGYGYEFTPGPARETIKARVAQELAKYQDEIRWALEEFGRKSATELELLTTIVYADREAVRLHQKISSEELGRRVKEVKPHFSAEYVSQNVHELATKALLQALTDGSSPPGECIERNRTGMHGNARE